MLRALGPPFVTGDTHPDGYETTAHRYRRLQATTRSGGGASAAMESPRMLGHQAIEEPLRMRLGAWVYRSRTERAGVRRCVSHALGNRAARRGFDGLVWLGRERGHERLQVQGSRFGVPGDCAALLMRT